MTRATERLLDIHAVVIDDYLLDRLAAGDGRPDSPVEGALHDWRDQLLFDLPPVPTERELRALTRGPRWFRRRPDRGDNPAGRSWHAVTGIAASIVLLLGGTTAIGARAAQPGDLLWPVTQALWGDRADSVLAHEAAAQALTDARSALSTGDLDGARLALAQAAAALPLIALTDGRDKVEADLQSLTVTVQLTVATPPAAGAADPVVATSDNDVPAGPPAPSGHAAPDTDPIGPSASSGSSSSKARSASNRSTNSPSSDNPDRATGSSKRSAAQRQSTASQPAAPHPSSPHRASQQSTSRPAPSSRQTGSARPVPPTGEPTKQPSQTSGAPTTPSAPSTATSAPTTDPSESSADSGSSAAPGTSRDPMSPSNSSATGTAGFTGSSQASSQPTSTSETTADTAAENAADQKVGQHNAAGDVISFGSAVSLTSATETAPSVSTEPTVSDSAAAPTSSSADGSATATATGTTAV